MHMLARQYRSGGQASTGGDLKPLTPRNDVGMRFAPGDVTALGGHHTGRGAHVVLSITVYVPLIGHGVNVDAVWPAQYA